MKLQLKTLLISVIGLFAISYALSKVDHYFFLDGIIEAILFIIFFCFFTWVIFDDIKNYQKDRSYLNFISTFTGLFIFFGFLLTLFILDQRDKSPSKLYCVTKVVDFNGASIDFRNDGTYKLSSYCMGEDIYRGTYSIKDSIVTLDRNEIEKIIESNRLLIRADGRKDSLGNIEKSIYQIDTAGHVINDAVDFRVMDKSKN